MFLTVIIFHLIMFGCASTIQNNANFNAETDCKDDGSFDFARFQVESKHPNRAIEIIKPRIKQCEKEILELMKANKKLLIDTNLIKMNIAVGYDGEFYENLLPSNLPADSLLNAKFKNLFKSLRLDSLGGYNSVAKVFVQIKELSKLDISDTVFYYQNRTRKSIMCVVFNNLPKIKDAYNRHLEKDGHFSGKTTVKFAVNEIGNVIHVEIIENTLNNKVFEKEEMVIIQSWKFPKINNPGDITEIVYPFIFGQHGQ
jgi:hypothetical protein